MMQRFLRLALASLICGLPSVAGATNLFSWNADQLSTTSLGAIITVHGGVSIDTSTKHSGTGSVKLVVPGNAQGQGGVEVGGNIILNPGQRYFQRWWMKFDSGFSWRTGGGFSTFKMDRKKRQGDAQPIWFTQHLEAWRISISECNECNPIGSGGDGYPAVNYDFNPQTNAALTSWHEYIVEIKLNSASGVHDGEYALWIDGVQIGRVTGQSYCCTTGTFNGPVDSWGSTMVRPYWQIQGLSTDGGTIWVDAFSSDDVWNSDTFQQGGGGGGGGDTIPPSQVTGLAVTTTGVLTWNAATDTGGSGLAGYTVRRIAGACGTPVTAIATTTSTTYTDPTASSGSTYCWSVQAFDVAGNQGTASTAVSATIASTFKSVLATDDFARTDNTDLGASWDAGYTSQTNAQIVSQRARSVTAGTTSMETYNAVSAGNDQYAQMTIPTLSTSGGGGGTPTFIQANTPTCGQSGLTATGSLTGVTAGHLLVQGIRFSSDNRSISSVAGNGNSYVAATGQSALNTSRLASHYAANVNSGATTVTTTFDSGAAYDLCPGLVEYSNVATSSPLDGASSGTQLSGSSVASGAVTTTQSGDLLVVVGFSENINRPITVPSGYTARVNVTTATYHLLIADKVAGAAGTENVTCAVTGGNSAIGCHLMAFKASGSGTLHSTAEVLVRAANAPTKTAYACAVNTNTPRFAILEYTAGTPATLTSTSGTFVPGHAIRCEVEGTAIRMYDVFGATETLLLSTTDATLTSGKLGFTVKVDATAVLTQAEIDDVVIGEFAISVPTKPTINSAVVDATGADLTWSSSPAPTSIKVEAYTVTGIFSSVIEPLSSFPAGRYTKTWAAAVDSVCFFAVDNIGAVNTTTGEYICDSVPVSTDTTPPVVTLVAPTSILPAGTTSTALTVSTDENALCHYDTSDVAYDSMASSYTTVNQLTHTVTISGLTNGSSTTYYTRCQDTVVPTPNQNSTSLSTTIQVDTSTADTTPPSTVTNLTAANVPASQSQVALAWSAATDDTAVSGYFVYVCFQSNCSDASVIGGLVPTTTTIVNLQPATTYYFAVKAVDSSNNLSAALSNIATATTSPVLDTTPPSDMGNLRAIGVFTQSVLLTWDPGTDNQSSPTISLEMCAGVGCSDFSTFVQRYTGTQLAVNLTPSTSYSFRGKFCDQAGNCSVNYSNTLTVTTLSVGLRQPRLALPFGIDRDAATARTVR